MDLRTFSHPIINPKAPTPASSTRCLICAMTWPACIGFSGFLMFHSFTMSSTDLPASNWVSM